MANVRIEVDLEQIDTDDLIRELHRRGGVATESPERIAAREELLEAFREGDATHFEIVLNRHLGD